MLFVLLIVFFINAEVHLTLEGADIQGVPHTFFFPTPYQFAAAVAFEAAEDRDTFLIPALLCQMGNVQDSRFVIDGKVKPFHHAVLHENVHKKLIPAPFLCQQIAFKLAAATPFQFQQHPFFQFRRYQNENITQIVMLRVRVKSVVFMDKVRQL